MPEQGHKLSAEHNRRGPIVCLQRGLRSLRANWELIPVLVVQSVLTTGLMLAGFFILLTAVGVSIVARVRDLGPAWPRQLAEELAASLETAPPALISLVAPLIAATLVWTLAFGLYCYLQAGVVGLLAEAEAAAGAGLPGWRSFRSFSVAAFDLRGRRLFWPYFWFNHLLGAVVLCWMLLALGLVALAVGLATGPDVSAGVAVGCVGLVPLGLLLLAIALWSMLATVEVARPGGGVWAASRRALATLRRRLGAVLVIWLLVLAGWMAWGAALAPLRWGAAIAAGDRMVVWLGARGALMLAEVLGYGVMAVVLVATLAALVGRPPAGETGAG